MRKNVFAYHLRKSSFTGIRQRKVLGSIIWIFSFINKLWISFKFCYTVLSCKSVRKAANNG